MAAAMADLARRAASRCDDPVGRRRKAVIGAELGTKQLKNTAPLQLELPSPLAIITIVAGNCVSFTLS
jgi:hypothetical protein